MKFKALRDRVFVKCSNEEKKTAGGFIFLDTAKGKPQRYALQNAASVAALMPTTLS